MDVADNTLTRPMQVSRGAVSEKRVYSKVALRLLESIKIEDLPEKERSESAVDTTTVPLPLTRRYHLLS
jgi:hypothetical protein